MTGVEGIEEFEEGCPDCGADEVESEELPDGSYEERCRRCGWMA